MSRIFFTVTNANPDGEPCVVASTYNETGDLLAAHVMTIEGAVIRMHDFQAAIRDAKRARRARARVTNEDPQSNPTRLIPREDG
jgi:hypothetical protein